MSVSCSPAVVLACGWACPPSRLRPLARALAAREIMVTDQPAALEERVAAERVPCWLAGWSLGGLLALQAALVHPQCVRGLILISTTARFCRNEDYPAGQPASVLRAMLRALSTGPEAVLDGFFRAAARPEAPSNAEIGDAVAGALAGGRSALRSGLDFFLRTDLRGRLPALDRPALVLHGERDEIIPAAAGRWLADHLPQAALRVHPDAGHELPLRHVDWVAEAMDEFMARSEAAVADTVSPRA